MMMDLYSKIMSIFSKKPSDFLGKKRARVPKSAQDTIPFIEAYENGLFLTGENTYTLIFAYQNIDYCLYRDEEKQDVYDRYIRLLNSLPTDIHYQEFIMNSEVNSDILEQTLLSGASTAAAYPDIAEDCCNIMNEYIQNTASAAAQKIMLIAMTYTPQGKIDNANMLFKYYQNLQTLFANLGSETRQLEPNEVFEVLYKFYHQFSDIPFMLPRNILSGNIKDYIAPSIFVFKNRQIEIGEQFTRVLFVRGYDRNIDDEFINDLHDSSEKITISKHLRRVDKGEAAEMVRKKIYELEGRIQKRMEVNHKNGTNFIPHNLKDTEKELQDLQERISGTGCEMFEISIFIAVTAQTEDELNELTRFVQNRAKSHQVILGILTRQQNKALDAVLPFALNNFNAKKNNNISTYLLSDAAGVMIPFSHIDHFAENGIFYGINQNTKTVIALDRTEEMNANGFVLGCSGSGKSMFSKAEMFDVLLKYPNDEIIVIDPENEYKPLVEVFDGSILKLSPSSPTKLNIFDVDLAVSEEGMSAIAMKSETIMTIVETAKGQALTSDEITIIDRCVKAVYQKYVQTNGNSKYLPTFEDFYNALLSSPEPEAHSLAVTLEIYVKGSFNIFSGNTNIDTSKRFMVFDIAQMGEQIRPVGLQVILEYVWQRVRDNKLRGVRTWVWIDEFSIMFNDGAGRTTHKSGEFFAKVYKRIRKYGGVPTAMTQNITEVLESPQARTMLSNSEFVTLLQQKSEDLKVLANLFSLSPYQQLPLKSGKKGTGVIICGNKIIPFEKIIPENSLMYKICTTKFDDIR